MWGGTFDYCDFVVVKVFKPNRMFVSNMMNKLDCEIHDIIRYFVHNLAGRICKCHGFYRTLCSSVTLNYNVQYNRG